MKCNRPRFPLFWEAFDANPQWLFSEFDFLLQSPDRSKFQILLSITASRYSNSVFLRNPSLQTALFAWTNNGWLEADWQNETGWSSIFEAQFQVSKGTEIFPIFDIPLTFSIIVALCITSSIEAKVETFHQWKRAWVGFAWFMIYQQFFREG